MKQAVVQTLEKKKPQIGVFIVMFASTCNSRLTCWFVRRSQKGKSFVQSEESEGKTEARKEFAVAKSCRESGCPGSRRLTTQTQGEGKRRKRKWRTWSVSTGQIRQAGGLASEDLIGLTLAADLLQRNSVSRKLEGISLSFSKNLSLCGWMTSSSSSSLWGGGGLGGFKHHLQRGGDLVLVSPPS